VGLIVFSSFAGHAAERALFPSPLHLTREVADPVAGTTTVIDEYCQGNRVVAVSGQKTAIADYDKGVITEIDFANGTYSVTRFEDIAKAQPSTSAELATSALPEWRVEAKGGKVIASRPVEMHEVARGAQTIRVSADRQLTLSRGAIETLLGFAYPYRRDPSADVVLGAIRSKERRVASNAASNTTRDDSEYYLPLEYAVRVELEGESIETRSVVTRVGSEAPPPERLTVPPGAKLVESRTVALRRLLEELDRPPAH
jgi:hypothetical protein